MAAQNTAITTNYIQTRIDKTQQNSKCRNRGAYDKFPNFFRMGTFIDSTRMKL